MGSMISNRAEEEQVSTKSEQTRVHRQRKRRVASKRSELGTGIVKRMRHSAQAERECWKRSINDVIHNDIQLSPLICSIIDTLEFQRLRNILQLGALDLVFPSATHTRFSHSLGTYWLAYKYIKELRITKTGSLLIDDRDELCVCIAALIHDIGHGPFSHMYDEFHAHLGVEGFKHEEQSARIFDHMLENNADLASRINEQLRPNDLLFIKELIDPPCPSMSSDGKWRPKGRPQEKAFLYEIVSNKEHGLDVDKMDYYLRDARYTNIGIDFTMVTVSRIMKGTRIICDDQGRYKLAYDKKNKEELRQAFLCRFELHKQLYKHKTCIALEHQLVEVLAEADPHLRFKGSDGREYRISDSWKNIAAYLGVDNRLTSMIDNSQGVELERARTLLRAFKQRRGLPKFIEELPLNPREFLNDGKKLNVHRVEEFIFKGILTLGKGRKLESSSFLVKVLHMHQGLGVAEHPMRRIQIYNRDDCPLELRSIEDSWMLANCPPTGGSLSAFVYHTAEADAEQVAALRSAMRCYTEKLR